MWERELRRESLGEEASASMMMKRCTYFTDQKFQRQKFLRRSFGEFPLLSLLTQWQYII